MRDSFQVQLIFDLSGAADFVTGHYLDVAKSKERLAVNK
jgi:hypothetical protein